MGHIVHRIDATQCVAWYECASVCTVSSTVCMYLHVYSCVYGVCVASTYSSRQALRYGKHRVQPEVGIISAVNPSYERSSMEEEWKHGRMARSP